MIDTILSLQTEINELVKKDYSCNKTSKNLGRKDSLTIEQILRSSYKELKSFNYEEIHYPQHNSRIWVLFIKLDGRSPISFPVWQE